MKKLLIILVLCAFFAPIVQAEKGMRPVPKSNTTAKSVKKKEKKFTLITVYRSQRNGVPFIGNDGDFYFPTPTGGNIFHGSMACRTEWLNHPVTIGSPRKNSYYFQSNGTQVVDDLTTFLVMCRQIYN